MKLKLFGSRKIVTTATTAERLTDQEIYVPAVSIQAESDNTADIFVGDKNVSLTNAAFVLDARDLITITAQTFGWANANISLRDIWIDTDSSGDGVFWAYLERM